MTTTDTAAEQSDDVLDTDFGRAVYYILSLIWDTEGASYETYESLQRELFTPLGIAEKAGPVLERHGFHPGQPGPF